MSFFKTSTLKLLVGVFALLGILNIGLVSSASAVPCQPTQDILGFPTWYEYLEGESAAENQGKCRPVINSSKDALPIGLAIFDIALTLAGLVAVAMVFIGAIRYILSLGEPAKAATAQHTVINALIGLVIVIIAARVVSFIAERITG